MGPFVCKCSKYSDDNLQLIKSIQLQYLSTRPFCLCSRNYTSPITQAGLDQSGFPPQLPLILRSVLIRLFLQTAGQLRCAICQLCMPPDARAWIDDLKWSGHSGCHTRLDEKVFSCLLTGHIRSKPHTARLWTTSPRTVFLLTERCSRAGFCYRRSLNGMRFRNSVLVCVASAKLCNYQYLAIALLSL